MNTRGPIMLVCVHMGTLAITPGLMGFLLDVTKYKSLMIINSYMWWLLELLIVVSSKPSKLKDFFLLYLIFGVVTTFILLWVYVFPTI